MNAIIRLAKVRAITHPERKWICWLISVWIDLKSGYFFNNFDVIFCINQMYMSNLQQPRLQKRKKLCSSDFHQSDRNPITIEQVSMKVRDVFSPGHYPEIRFLFFSTPVINFCLVKFAEIKALVKFSLAILI